MQYRTNLISLTGAIIGIGAIFMTWISISILIWHREMNLIDVINLTETRTLLIGGILFLFGSFVALLTPLGAFSQMGGLALFMSWYVQETGHMPSSIGPYAGIASAVVILIGFFKPIGINYDKGPIDTKGRFLNFSEVPKLNPQTPPPPSSAAQQSFQTPPMPAYSYYPSSVSQGMGGSVYCPNCGSPLEGGSVCKYCGVKIG